MCLKLNPQLAVSMNHRDGEGDPTWLASERKKWRLHRGMLHRRARGRAG